MTIDTSLIDTPQPQYATWEERRAAVLEHARQRPAMYVGDPETAHLGAIADVSRLMWMARIFHLPGRCRVILSPTQYVVIGEAGPLVGAIEKTLTFGGGRILSEPWRAELAAYFQQIWESGRDGGRAVSDVWHNKRWRYTFTGPIGPRLDCPGQHDLLATRFLWGIRASDGLWCEGYKDGWPVGRPFVVDAEPSVAIVAAGELSSEWFPGLPFDQEDVDVLRAQSGKRVRLKWSNIRSFTNGEFVVEWRDEDLLGAGLFTEDGVGALCELGINRR